MLRCTLTNGRPNDPRRIVIEGPDDTVAPGSMCIVRVTWDDGTVSSATLRGVPAARECMEKFVLLGAGRGFPNAEWMATSTPNPPVPIETVAPPDAIKERKERERKYLENLRASAAKADKRYFNRCANCGVEAAGTLCLKCADTESARTDKERAFQYRTAVPAPAPAPKPEPIPAPTTTRRLTLDEED